MVDAIPIYWGDPDIGKCFNSKSFVNCHEFDNLEAVIARVKQIDADDPLYREMLRQPWFANAQEPTELADDTLINFLRNIFDQPVDQAFRRNRSRWGRKYEDRLRRMWAHPLQQMWEQFRGRLR